MIPDQTPEDPTLAPPRPHEGEQCVTMTLVVGAFGQPEKVLAEVRTAVLRRLWLEFGPAASVLMDGVRYRYRPLEGVTAFDSIAGVWRDLDG